MKEVGAFLCALALFTSTTTLYAGQDVLWSITQLGCFDPTNKAYDTIAERVVVDLNSPQSQCPTGLGGLAEGRGKVREIVLTYQVAAGGDYWLHIPWDPGGSGKEQFDVICNGQTVGATDIVDATLEPQKTIRSSFRMPHKPGANEIVLRHLSGDGLRFHDLLLASSAEFPRLLPPTLPYPNAAAFSKAIHEPAALLDSPNVAMLVPQRRKAAAAIVLPYLVRAYDELYKIVGVDTEYKIVIYAFPQGFPGVRGGTAGCVIRYTDENLDLARKPEWKRFRVPHVSGYIEEMAHNFVHATGAEFGWEMIGWSIAAKVHKIVAPNPISKRDLESIRVSHAATYMRYKAAGYTFPRELASDQADRIHAYLLWKCERQYGPNFWSDFFAEVRKERAALFAPAARGESAGLDLRYRITIACLDRLPDLHFKRLLESNGISTAVAVQSLKPTAPGWNRKLH